MLQTVRNQTATNGFLLVFAGLLVAVMPSLVSGLGDTDAVVVPGLFPILGGDSLVLDSVQVTVTLTRRGVETRRLYSVRNLGDSTAATLGTIWRRNRESFDSEDSAVVRVADQVVSSVKQIAYLKDKGSRVSIIRKDSSEVLKCLEHLDGNVCCQSYTEFDAVFGAGEVKMIELIYVEEIERDYPGLQIVKPICFYTEKFWAGDKIPMIEFRFGIEGSRLPLEALTPKGPLAQYSTPPNFEDNGLIVWRFKDHQPQKTEYTYQQRLVHGSAIDFALICKAYLEATGIVLWRKS